MVLSVKGIGDYDIANVRLGCENPEWYNAILYIHIRMKLIQKFQLYTYYGIYK